MPDVGEDIRSREPRSSGREESRLLRRPEGSLGTWRVDERGRCDCGLCEVCVFATDDDDEAIAAASEGSGWKEKREGEVCRC